MWICSTLGYFSIVKKNGDFYVRARSVNDLEILKEASGVDAEIKIFPNTDYVARLIVDKKEVGKIFSTLQDTISYPNFKDKIHDTVSQKDKLASYSKIWGIMFEYQERILQKQSRADRRS